MNETFISFKFIVVFEKYRGKIHIYQDWHEKSRK